MISMPYHILMVEDNPGDALLIEEALAEAGNARFRLEHVERLSEAMKLLDWLTFDAVLLDLSLPDSEGLATLARMQAHLPGTPVVILTGQDDEMIALKAVQAGAQDYMVKGQVFGTMLVRAIRYAIERQRSERALRESEERFRQLTERIPQIFWLIDAAFREVLYVSPAFEVVTGRTCESLYADPRSFLDAVHPEDRPIPWEGITGRIPDEWDREYRIVRPDGTVRWLRDRGRSIRSDAGEVIRFAALLEDVTGERESQERIRLQADLLAAVGEAVVATDLDGTIFYWNSAAERLYGWSASEALGRNLWDGAVASIPAQRGADIQSRFPAGERWSREFNARRRDGTIFPVLMTDAPIRDKTGALIGIVGVSTDLTEIKRLQEQLQQAQRMEAVGRLAGGVAHDFNNILMGIQGYTHFLLEDLNPSDPLREDAEEIKRSAMRAADLTRQLLAFSRKQVLQPRVLDLGSVVEGMEKMLGRLIGEDVELAVTCEPDLWRVKADPSQVEQVVLNLVVNARDAMPRGGQLIVGLKNVYVSDSYPYPHDGLATGSYVVLTVSDTGTGIPRDVLPHIFEPFFTTKEKGRGTGLGLSTVYGIVRQSGGNVHVYSEAGHGTTFRVYLPRICEEVEVPDEPPSRAASARGETILLVEDEPAVRALVVRTLEKLGYVVLEASNGGEALLLTERHRGEIDLLITDVVMPYMSGRDLADRLVQIRPGLRVLYMSGYTDDMIAHHGILAPDLRFLEKPFSPAVLGQKVRESLDLAVPKP